MLGNGASWHICSCDDEGSHRAGGQATREPIRLDPLDERSGAMGGPSYFPENRGGAAGLPPESRSALSTSSTSKVLREEASHPSPETASSAQEPYTSSAQQHAEGKTEVVHLGAAADPAHPDGAIGFSPGNISVRSGIDDFGLVSFDLQLTKEEGTTYGLAHVPVRDGTNTLLIVEWKEDGPVGKWNRARRDLGSPEQQVERGDRITSVNGVSDTDGMRSALRLGQIRLAVERWPERIVVSLQKRNASDRYGLRTDLIPTEVDGKHQLRVIQVVGGLVGEWNAWACLTKRFFEVVSPGLEIVQVDELQGLPEKMQEAMSSRDKVEITMKRPDPSEYR